MTKILKKRREKQQKLIKEILKGEFRWIYSVTKIRNFIPTSYETYSIEFGNIINPIEYFGGGKKSEKERFEKFIFEYYQVEKGRHQVIILWQERGLVFTVFRSYN